jgi:hypothetical protein
MFVLCHLSPCQAIGSTSLPERGAIGVPSGRRHRRRVGFCAGSSSPDAAWITLAGVTPAQFWAGPQHQAIACAGRRKGPTRDSVTPLVLVIHAEADRPLGFEQVVELSGNRGGSENHR